MVGNNQPTTQRENQLPAEGNPPAVRASPPTNDPSGEPVQRRETRP
ncbi:MAG: hypothetical protein ACHBN1_14655 [Heteroscytonema crispum UTEX LB 1556]